MRFFRFIPLYVYDSLMMLSTTECSLKYMRRGENKERARGPLMGEFPYQTEIHYSVFVYVVFSQY